MANNGEWDEYDNDGHEDWYGSPTKTSTVGAPPAPGEAASKWGEPGPDPRVRYIDGVALAGPWQRLIALTVDFFIVVLLPLEILRPVLPPAAPLMLAIGLMIANFYGLLVLVASGGTSRYRNTLGKHIVRIRAVRPVKYAGGQTLANVGGMRTFWRINLHFFDVFFMFIGLLWVFGKNGYQRTWADCWTHIVHIRINGKQPAILPKAPRQSVNMTY